MISRGHMAEHVADALTPNIQDSEIVKYANANDAVVVTKDSDFLTLAPPPPLILVTTGNISNQALLGLFERRFGAVLEALSRGRAVIEIS